MRLCYTLLTLLFSSLLLSGQSIRHAAETAERYPARAEFCVSEGALPFAGEAPFFGYYLTWEAGPLAAEIRFTKDGRHWTPWQAFERYDHNPDRLISQLYIGEAAYTHYQLRLPASEQETIGYTLHLTHPDASPQAHHPTHSPLHPLTGGPRDCPCPQPGFLDRLDWCPSGECPEDSAPVSTEVSHLIIHHSAGPNSAGDWAARVRIIWDFHVNGNGWDDIGYNWLIAPTGELFQGRGDNIRGAHFCGSNSNTMGVCVMGTFTDVTPTTAALNTLEKLLAWKACDRDIDVLGESFHPSSGFTLPNMAGHRDGCSTECPGDLFYPLLPGLRENVANRIEVGCVALESPVVLSATYVNDSSYQLQWRYEDPAATGFELERSTDGGDNFSLLANLPADNLSYTEDDLDLDALYDYRVRAYNDTLYSGYSNTLTINTVSVATGEPGLPPSLLTLAPNPTRDHLHLQWQLESNEPLSLSLLDVHQRLLRQWPRQARPPVELRLDKLPAGVYFLRVRQGARQGTWRFVRQE